MMRIILITLLGSSAGSFLVSASRGNAFRRRSRCDHCGRVIPFYDLIPISSYLLLGGKTRCCGKKLESFYPAGELICAAASLVCAMRAEDPSVLAKDLLIVYVLFYVSAVDIKRMIVPDASHAILLIIRIFLADDGRPLQSVLAASLVFSGCILVMTGAMNIAKDRECMGAGDIKLLFSLSLHAPLMQSVHALLLSALSALVFMLATGRKNGMIPFAPFICLSFFFTSIAKIGR